MISKRTTRKGSGVYFQRIQGEENPVFEAREFNIITEFDAKVFKSKQETDPSVLWQAVEGLYRNHCKTMCQASSLKAKVPVKRTKKTWKDHVNSKRRLVAAYMSRQTAKNIAAACRFAKCSTSMAKRVEGDLLMSGEVDCFEYNNMKNEATLRSVEHSITTLQGTFKTLADLKRENPSCSRKWLAKQVRDAKYRWLMMRKERKGPPPVKPASKKVVEVIDHLIQLMSLQIPRFSS